MSEQTAEEKGWLFLKDTLQDDAAYAKLRTGTPIQLTGSLGTPFILYPSGSLVKVGKDEPEIGEIIEGSSFVAPDYLATIIAWIKYDEKGLEENWGCGKISMQEPRRRLSEEELQILRRDIERIGAPYGSKTSWIVMIGTLACCLALGYILIPQLTAMGESTFFAEKGITDAWTTINSLFPIIFVLVIFLSLFNIVLKSRW